MTRCRFTLSLPPGRLCRFDVFLRCFPHARIAHCTHLSTLHSGVSDGHSSADAGDNRGCQYREQMNRTDNVVYQPGLSLRISMSRMSQDGSSTSKAEHAERHQKTGSHTVTIHLSRINSCRAIKTCVRSVVRLRSIVRSRDKNTD